MERGELGGEIGRTPVEDMRGGTTASQGSVKTVSEGMERTMGVGQSSGSGISGPVKAEKLGAEYDVTTYPIFSKSKGISDLNETLTGVYGSSYSIRGDTGPRRLEENSTRPSTEAERMLKALIEERTLALSKGPSVFRGDQPVA